MNTRAESLELLQMQIVRLIERLQSYMQASEEQLQRVESGIKQESMEGFLNRWDIPVLQALQSTPPVAMTTDIVPETSRLNYLVSRFKLTPFERDVLIMTLMPQFDRSLSHYFSKIQKNSRAIWPSVDLALKSLAWGEPIQFFQHFLEPDATLFRYGLVKTIGSEDYSWNQEMLKIDPEIYYYLLGFENRNYDMHSHTKLLPVAESKNFLPEITRRLEGFLKLKDKSMLITLKETQQGVCHYILPHITMGKDAGVLQVDLLQFPVGDEHVQREFIWVLREASLYNNVIVFTGLKYFVETYPHLVSWLICLLNIYPVILFNISESDEAMINLDGLCQQTVVLPGFSFTQEIRVMEYQLSHYRTEKDVCAEALVRRFHLAPNKLGQALKEADVLRMARSRESLLNNEDICSVFKVYSQQPFGKLAKRIEPKRDFSDLVIGEQLQQQLNEVLVAIRQRESTLQRGFERKIAYGTGISVLLHGDSGTGKTMVAEILAKHLGVDLVKVDISNVVNKYIGETEKNLSRIFDHAQKDAGVLFFDEADALFGKRSETKDAHDRHANIEVSYLLQRFEDYPGLVILSTNNRHHLDEAFTRRLTFIIRFPFPDALLREKMWRGIWPPQIKISEDIDFTELAKKAEITGANIKNVALFSSWLAAEEGSECINMKHIQRALQRELTKIGRINLN